MRTHPALRQRVPSEIVVGAANQIQLGAFGVSNPIGSSMIVNPFSAGPLYNFHEGDLFTPGTGNWVFESIFELNPLLTIWGNAFLRRPNTFNPIQPPQVMSQPHVLNNGIGGLQAGTMDLEPLIYEGV